MKNNKDITISSGLVIIQDNKILLVHPSNSPWWGTYSIPKGHVDKNENIYDAAIRETYEETGINIKDFKYSQGESGVINYDDEKGNIYKKVHYFVIYPSEPITNFVFTPQLKEVDWIGFLSNSEAEKRIFGRFKPLLKYIKP